MKPGSGQDLCSQAEVHTGAAFWASFGAVCNSPSHPSRSSLATAEAQQDTAKVVLVYLVFLDAPAGPPGLLFGLSVFLVCSIWLDAVS